VVGSRWAPDVTERTPFHRLQRTITDGANANRLSPLTPGARKPRASVDRLKLQAADRDSAFGRKISIW
jgi:hypothetical protein